MKKIRKFIKSNIKVIVAFIIGVVISGTGVYAASILYSSDQVSYDNSKSNLNSVTVQDALDELYNKVNSKSDWVDGYIKNSGKPTRYIFQGSTPPSSGNGAPPDGREIYLAYYGYADDNYGVCIKRFGGEHCFRANNFLAESYHLRQVFANGQECHVSSSEVWCGDQGRKCEIHSNGAVRCQSPSSGCEIYVGGSVRCSQF